ncbi:glycosyltransferase family 2 protein [Eubacterium sp. AB3007]|uniref:glycosyltransferase family 2 protein n=1 Tax=Eubacterium sp. AB3007 TaxID=1392487 RepID=UPI000480E899|nr:glycosyltransferase family 2 protein [Eubacterium sp. AB3007]
MIEISIIIPCYNCADWIDRCIYALERQTYKKFEVICIDDCSNDNTFEKLNEIRKHISFELRVLQNNENCGPAKSRNYGISLAKGRYLAFCDSDDWYEDNYVEEMHRALLRDGADLVMCEYRKVYESSNRVDDMHYLKNFSGSRDDLIAYSKAAMWLIMYKRELTLDLEVPDLRNGEDIAYVPCIESRAQKITVVKKILYNYLMRKGSTSKTPSVSVYKSLLTAYEFIKNNYINDDLSVKEYLGIKTVMYGAVLNACKAGEKGKEIRVIVDEFEKDYPNWVNNKYMYLFNKKKQLFLSFVKHRRISLCKAYSTLHQLVSV